MARRNNKKFEELNQAKNFVDFVIKQMSVSVKSKQLNLIVENLRKEMPKFDNNPRLKKTYNDILNRVASGTYSPQLAIQYFQREGRRLTDEMNSL